MPLVAPGNDTGVYYIPVASLPFGCSWQKLKDFSRNQQSDGTIIEIDRVHVYDNNHCTNGWVRVKGHGNFLRLKAHFQKDCLDHRSLISEFKNETESVMIRDDISSPPLTSSVTARSDSFSSVDTFAPSTTASLGHQSSSSTSTYSGHDGWYNHSFQESAMSPTSLVAPYHPPYPQAGIYGAYGTQNYTPVDYYQSPAPGVMYENATVAPVSIATPMVLSPEYRFPAPIRYNETYLAPLPESPIVRMEAREVLITRLPHSTTYDELQKLVLRHIARTVPSSKAAYDQLEKIEINFHSDRRPRGHAFAILTTESVAEALVQSLNGAKFQGRSLGAKLTKEGVQMSRKMPPHRQFEHQIPSSSETYSAATPVVEASLVGTTTFLAPRTVIKSIRESRDPTIDKKKSTSPVVVNGSTSGTSSRSRDEKGKRHRG